MITTAEEYFAELAVLQNVNQPIYALLPTSENTYKIDINSRTVEVPKFLALEKDHNSETIYFEIDRYADYMDLSQTCCVIQFNTSDHKTRYYNVPFYDIYKFADQKKMVFPWCLDAHVTDNPGKIEFSIRFFKLGEVIDENNQAQPVLDYNLSTLPAIGTVLKGIDNYRFEDDEYFLKPSESDRIWEYIQNIERRDQLYWTILDDSYESQVDYSDIQDELSQIIQNTNK